MPDDTTAALTDQMIDADAARLRASFAAKHEKMVLTTAHFRHFIEEIRARGFATHAVLWNASLYLQVAAHDLSLLVEDLTFQRDAWARRFTARHLALLTYEVTEDMRAILGRTFRDALQTLSLLDRFDSRLRAARKPLDEFWDSHQAALKHIRITTAAHREHDGVAMLAAIETLDVHEFIGLGAALGAILNDLGKALQSILTDSSEVMPPELQR